MNKAEQVFEKIALSPYTILGAISKRVMPNLPKGKRALYRETEKALEPFHGTPFFYRSGNIKPLSAVKGNKSKIKGMDAHKGFSAEVSKVQKAFPNKKRLKILQGNYKKELYEMMPGKKELRTLKEFSARSALQNLAKI